MCPSRRTTERALVSGEGISYENNTRESPNNQNKEENVFELTTHLKELHRCRQGHWSPRAVPMMSIPLNTDKYTLNHKKKLDYMDRSSQITANNKCLRYNHLRYIRRPRWMLIPLHRSNQECDMSPWLIGEAWYKQLCSGQNWIVIVF